MPCATNRPVLVVGAGPTGLVLALTLARFGTPVRIVDRLTVPATVSKALAVWSGSLEALAALGTLDAFLAESVRMDALRVGDGSHELAAIPVAEGVDSAYPFTIIIPQSRTEAILAARLADLGVTVERGVTLAGFTEESDGVAATLERPDGRRETFYAACVVGCDGARSTVRHGLGLDFAGYTEPQTFILCDAVMDGALDGRSIYIWWSGAGSVALFPLGGDVWRMFAMREETTGTPDETPPTLDEMQRHLAACGPPGLALRDPRWLSAFRINERLVERYRVGRAFLAGDAAHVHSPAGGQGMNTGIQDAVNLGWKLATVLAGRGEADALLDSYEAERRPVARAVVAAAAQKLHIGMTGRGTGQRLMRDALVSIAARLPAVRRMLQVELSETDVTYRAGPLVEIARRGAAGRPGPGERARDATVVGADGAPGPLWPLLCEARHTLLLFGDPARHAPLAARAKSLGGAVGTVALDAARDPGGAAAARYGVHGDGWVLLRPDQVVAARGGADEDRAFTAYVGRVLEPR